MGWWSTDVLGGDAPLDCISVLERILDVEDLYPLEDIADRGAVAERLTARIDTVARELGDDPIGWQVVAAVCIATGTVLPPVAQDAAHSAIRDDDWARTDRGRAEAMAQLLADFDAISPGVPGDVPTTGLLESVALMRLSGQGGLVNLTPPSGPANP